MFNKSKPRPERLERLPPYAFEMEQGVLGCVLVSPNECLAECLEQLKDGHLSFYDLRHQTIYQELLDMFNQRQNIDLVSVVHHLKERGVLDQVGGAAYLNALMDCVPSAANLGYYLKIVEEKYLLRKMIQTLTEAVWKIYDNNDEVETLLDGIEREVLHVRQMRTTSTNANTKEIVQQALDEIDKIALKKGISGIGTGFIDLDKWTDGMHPGDMLVVAAWPSVGKTSLAMNIAEHVLLQEHLPVGVFSLEMTSVQLVTRFICSHARVNLRNLREGFMTERDFPKMVMAAGRIGNAAIFFDDSSDLSIYQLRAKARRMHQRHGIRLFVVDYLQLLNATGGPRRSDSREQEVADISGGLKSMAKELGVPVLVLSQLNDDGKLRESRRIGMDADGLWFLERDKESAGYEEGEAVNLKIRKNRNGPRDVTVPLTFLKNYTRFESAAKVSDADVPEQGTMV